MLGSSKVMAGSRTGLSAGAENDDGLSVDFVVSWLVRCSFLVFSGGLLESIWKRTWMVIKMVVTDVRMMMLSVSRTRHWKPLLEPLVPISSKLFMMDRSC